MSEVTATEEKLKPLIESTGGGTVLDAWRACCPSVGSSGVDCPASPCWPNAACWRVGLDGLKDREAFVTPRVKLIRCSRLLALAALLASGLTWWREGADAKRAGRVERQAMTEREPRATAAVGGASLDHPNPASGHFQVIHLRKRIDRPAAGS